MQGCEAFKAVRLGPLTQAQGEVDKLRDKGSTWPKFNNHHTDTNHMDTNHHLDNNHHMAQGPPRNGACPLLSVSTFEDCDCTEAGSY